jgi:hypothetical protein
MLFGKKYHDMDQLVIEFSLHFSMHITMNNKLKIFFFYNKNIKQIIHRNMMELKSYYNNIP